MLQIEENEKCVNDSYELPNEVLVAVPKPLVSIRISTYNHFPFISNCIEGVLMQRTSFQYEIIIGEDFSTDGTREIVFDYANKYPEKIRVITAQYNIGGRANRERCEKAARGKYFALCEGDDYWTDPLKLQKQVDFLESNPGYNLTCGGYLSINAQTGEKKQVILSKASTEKNGFTFSLDDMLIQWITKTLTVVYRKDAVHLEEFLKYRYSKDVHLIYHLIKNSKGFYFTQILGAYHSHSGGIFSSKSIMYNLDVHLNVYQELFEQNRDEFTRLMYLKTVLLNIKHRLKGFVNKRSSFDVLKLFALVFKIIKIPGDLLFIIRGVKKSLR